MEINFFKSRNFSTLFAQFLHISQVDFSLLKKEKENAYKKY